MSGKIRENNLEDYIYLCFDKDLAFCGMICPIYAMI